MIKYWPAVCSKSKLQNPAVALLYSISHTQFYEFTFRRKNLYLRRNWLAISFWVWWLHLDWWKKSPVYHFKLAHKEKRSSNQPTKAACSHWSALLIIPPRLSKIQFWLRVFLPGCRHLPDPLPAPQCCDLKAPAHGSFDTYFRTIFLWLKASLPALPRASLTGKGWPPILGGEPHPWVLRTSPRGCPPFLCTSQRSDLPLTRSPLLLLAGWVSPPTWWDQKIPVNNQKNKPYLYPVNKLRMDREPARNQELSDIPKAWGYTWITQESFPSE